MDSYCAKNAETESTGEMDIELLTRIAKDVHIILGIHLVALFAVVVIVAIWFYDRMT